MYACAAVMHDGAVTATKPENRRVLGVILIVAASIVGLVACVAVVLYIYAAAFDRAFVTPSQSMCPTICQGERFLANMYAYQLTGPQRGDVIMLEVPQLELHTLLVKRVVGMPGDTVESGPHGQVVVNGEPLKPARTCGVPMTSQDSAAEMPNFPRTGVPKGSFFVVGDNLADSNDSRFPGFGLVDLSQVRGKPEFIYWSTGKSRIGCSIR